MNQFNYTNDDVIIEPIHKADHDREAGKSTQMFEKAHTLINGHLK